MANARPIHLRQAVHDDDLGRGDELPLVVSHRAEVGRVRGLRSVVSTSREGDRQDKVETTIPHTPQQNGKAERGNLTSYLPGSSPWSCRNRARGRGSSGCGDFPAGKCAGGLRRVDGGEFRAGFQLGGVGGGVGGVCRKRSMSDIRSTSLSVQKRAAYIYGSTKS
jgi:hypothetical protein